MGGLTGVTDAAKDLFKIVGDVAPLLGSVLGSPLAGVGIALLSHAFGTKSNTTSAVPDLLAAINASPESALKIKTVEYEHAEMLAKIASSDYSTEVDDRKDARKYGEQYKAFMTYMAIFVTAGFFLALFGLFFPLTIAADEKNLLSLLVGMLASKWSTIIDFFFGSSRTQSTSQGVTNGSYLSK